MRASFFHKMAVSMSLLTLAFMCTAHAEDPLIGLWQAEDGAALRFYGNQIGREGEGEGAAYFGYEYVGTDAVVLNYGNGEEKAWTFALSGDQLILTDKAANAVSYVRATDPLTVCVRQLHQLAGAKALFFEENPQQEHVGPRELLEYLQDIPECPAGGMYLIEARGLPPQCTIPEHRIEDGE